MIKALLSDFLPLEVSMGGVGRRKHITGRGAGLKYPVGAVLSFWERAWTLAVLLRGQSLRGRSGIKQVVSWILV